MAVWNGFHHRLGNGGWRLDTLSITNGFACCGMAPAISLQPSSQTARAGSNVTFLAEAIGTPPLGCQWLFNGGLLYGATSNSLVLTNVQPEQAGGYSLVFANASGSITSIVATLTVLVPPVFSAQPTDQTVMVGMEANFLSTASGNRAAQLPMAV